MEQRHSDEWRERPTRRRAQTGFLLPNAPQTRRASQQ
jgi:hypothetical protein